MTTIGPNRFNQSEQDYHPDVVFLVTVECKAEYCLNS